jgi:tetratricopeptide (TPR) repeat protein
MAAAKIPPFPYDAAPYSYEGDALKKAWDRLHRGDREPFPADAKLQSAWRAFHRGDFARAIAEGAKLKASGATVANKSAAVAATYLVDDDKTAIRLLLEAAARADAATRESPRDANAWYMQAFVLGRYAQGVSVMKALAEGIGSKVKKALDRALALEPKHADAHIALGLYHAEIVDKVGALAGRLTYGADAGESAKHFEQALRLNPGSAIAHMEYGNALLMLHGDKKHKQAVELYRKAAACRPADAMERLDVEQAKAELE